MNILLSVPPILSFVSCSFSLPPHLFPPLFIAFPYLVSLETRRNLEFHICERCSLDFAAFVRARHTFAGVRGPTITFLLLKSFLLRPTSSTTRRGVGPETATWRDAAETWPKLLDQKAIASGLIIESSITSVQYFNMHDPTGLFNISPVGPLIAPHNAMVTAVVDHHSWNYFWNGVTARERITFVHRSIARVVTFALWSMIFVKKYDHNTKCQMEIANILFYN